MSSVPAAPGSIGRWAALGRLAAAPAVDLVNLFFPSDCRLCAAPLLHVSRVPVCQACRDRISALATETLCTRCGDALGFESARFAGASGITECMLCRLAPPPFVRAVAFAAYDDSTRELLHLLKFAGMAAVASTVLGSGMAVAMRRLEDEAGPEALVVPVPLFGARERARRYNQARLLAEAAVTRLRTASPAWQLTMRSDVLRRVRDTRSSFSMAPHVRRQNLRGAFRVANADALRGRKVVLVDDILTTGATARECARVLLRAGAAGVWVATYARTLAEDVGPSAATRWTVTAEPPI